MIVLVRGNERLAELYEPIVEIKKVPVGGGVVIKTRTLELEVKEFKNPDTLLNYVLVARKDMQPKIIVDILTGHVSALA